MNGGMSNYITPEDFDSAEPFDPVAWRESMKDWICPRCNCVDSEFVVVIGIGKMCFVCFDELYKDKPK